MDTDTNGYQYICRQTHVRNVAHTHSRKWSTYTYDQVSHTHSELDPLTTLRINNGGLTFPIGPILLIGLHGKGPHDETHVCGRTLGLCVRLIECVSVVQLIPLRYEHEATLCASQCHSSSV